MARIQVVNYLLPGVAVLDCPFFPDARGSFTKLYHQHALAEQGFDVKVAESFSPNPLPNFTRNAFSGW